MRVGDAAAPIEIQEQADVEAGGFQIGFQLGKVDVRQGIDGL